MQFFDVQFPVPHDQAASVVDLMQGAGGRRGLGFPDILLPMDDLSLEIGRLNAVEVDQYEGAHTAGRKIYRGRGAEPAEADHQCPRIEQLLLSLLPD